ncbi:hypothetical protein IRZ71_05715 [Flavobacterium sp. ANB]|uniref:hypothetical protein n=1 Tax=unclassified Flavobacterium TaxID=196869 RepID=UPI0012B704D1|nr:MULTISPECIES: hypothetical protein [unclassified Flavobacterium]MBF4515828.1 hypothetical protein [Flavobacterium sp. ANB]MTD68831.1 hypothetical protein [Flavobacterium sp. LC2016-13]
MRKMLFTVVGFVLLFSCQNNSKPVLKKPVLKVVKLENSKSDDNEVYNLASVDTLPKYPGGIEKFHAFLKKNYVIPEEVIKNEALGHPVFATIKIEKDGTVSEIEIIRDFGYGSGPELKRVLKLSSNWVPAIKDGKPVRCLYSIPYYVY